MFKHLKQEFYQADNKIDVQNGWVMKLLNKICI